MNVDEKAVRQAIAQGKIKKGVDKKTGKIKPSIAIAEWGHLHETPKPQRGVSKAKAAQKMETKKAQEQKPLPEKKITIAKKEKEKKSSEEFPDEKDFSYEELIRCINIYPDLTYGEAIRRKEILNIASERMNLEQQQNLLVRKAEVEKALFAVGDMLKKSMFNIVARCIDDIMTAPNKVEAGNILTLEIASVFKQFSQHLDPTS